MHFVKHGSLAPLQAKIGETILFLKLFTLHWPDAPPFSARSERAGRMTQWPPSLCDHHGFLPSTVNACLPRFRRDSMDNFWNGSVTVTVLLSKLFGQKMSSRVLCNTLLALTLTTAIGIAQAGKPPPYTYSSVGNPAVAPSVSSVQPYSSYVLMGGGPDVDEAFRWMIRQAGITPGTGGRLVVIRATGDGAYNPYIYYSSAASSTASADIVDGWVGGASMGLTSVETLVVPSIAAANDAFVNAVIGRANAVWIAGGDQSDYIKFWKGQALEK